MHIEISDQRIWLYLLQGDIHFKLRKPSLKQSIMNKILLAFSLLISIILRGQNPAEKYDIDSASVEHADVPKGEVLKFTFDHSTIFPGTSREYWIYVPAQYKAGKPACVYVNQDGIQWKAPTVFDNLIYKKEMPVTIGVFVTPGKVLTTNGSPAWIVITAVLNMMD